MLTIVCEPPSGHVPPAGVLGDAFVGARVLLLEAGDLQHTADLAQLDLAGKRLPVAPVPADLGDGAGKRGVTSPAALNHGLGASWAPQGEAWVLLE